MIGDTTTACTINVPPSQPSPGTSTLLGLHSPWSPDPSLCPLTPSTTGAAPHPTKGPGSVSSLHLKVFIARGEKKEETMLLGQEDALWDRTSAGGTRSPMGHKKRAHGLQGAVIPSILAA